MSLDFKNIASPLVKGVDRSDNFLTAGDVPTRAENATFDGGSSLQRSEVTVEPATFTEQEAQVRAHTLGATYYIEARAKDSAAPVVYSSTGGTLKTILGSQPVLRTGIESVRNFGAADSYDIASLPGGGGVWCVATLHGTALTVTVLNSDGTIIDVKGGASITGGHLRVVATNVAFHIYVFSTSTKIKCYVHTVNSRTMQSADLTLTGHTDIAFDAVHTTTSGTVLVAVHSTSGGTNDLRTYHVTGSSPPSWSSVLSTYGTQVRCSNLSMRRMFKSATHRAIVVFGEVVDSSTQTPKQESVSGYVYAMDGTIVTAASAPASPYSPQNEDLSIGRVVADPYDYYSGYFGYAEKTRVAVTRFACTTTAVRDPRGTVALDGTETVQKSQVDWVGFELTDASTLARWVADYAPIPQATVHSAPLVDPNNGDLTIPVTFNSESSPTVHVLRLSGALAYWSILASLASEEAGFETAYHPYVAGVLTAFRNVPGVITFTDNTRYVIPVGVLSTRQAGYAAPGTDYFANKPGQDLKLFTLDEEAALGHVEYGGVTHLAGAQPLLNDGQYIREHAELHPPQILSLTATADGDGELESGKTYKVCCTWSFTDLSGVVHESSPSAVASVTTAAISYYTLTLASSEPYLSHILDHKLNIYRTVGDGSTFYLDTAAAKDLSLTDSLLVYQKQLYTQSEARNAPAPSCHSIVEHQNRLFCTDGYEIRYTKDLTPGYAPRWLPSTDRVIVPDTFGRAVALMSMDERLVVFCERAIGVVQGEGPSLRGGDGSYTALIEAVTGYGMKWGYPKALVLTDKGIWFQSRYGVRLLARNMQIARTETQELGAEMDAFIGTANVVSALYHPKLGQARFYLDKTSDNALVWNDQAGAFTTLNFATSGSLVDAVVYDSGSSVSYIPVSSKVVYSQTPGVYSVVGGSPTAVTNKSTMVVETGWIKLEGLQNLQRITHLMLLGELAATAGGEYVEVAYATDYDGDYAKSGTSSGWTSITSATLTPVRNTGNVSQVEMEVHLPVQKCEAIKFRITTYPTSTTTTNSFRLTGITLRAGFKPARQRPATRL